jgi:TPR repeat protein
MTPILEERTMRFLKERTTNGSPEASFDLYERYKIGKGVNQDKEEALRYLKMSAEFGNTRAKQLLGLERLDKVETNSPPISPNVK